MKKLLHIAAVAALIGSALYAYRIKYDTIYLAEQVAKLKAKSASERDAIAVLRAEWQFLNKPDRVQALSDRYTDLVAFNIEQIVRWSDVPNRAPDVDSIGRKLESLGLAEPTNTPSSGKASGATGGKTP